MVNTVESSKGWMDAAPATESGGGGWNAGGQSTERLYGFLYVICLFFKMLYMIIS